MPLYSVKTTKSEEKTVADMITERGVEGIHAALAPENMSSYIIVEAENSGLIERALEEIPHAQKVLQGQVSMAEVESFFSPSSDVENVTQGDLVEIIDGPYSGEKARVENIDSSQEKVTVKLVDATVPIPVEMPGNQVKRLDSEERDT